jgi:hypothetical protein
MKTSVSVLVIALLAIAAMPALAEERTAVVYESAPIYLTPDATRAPLRTASVNTVLRVHGEEGDWLRVEFRDPQFGNRMGYVQTKHVRVSRPELEAMDLSVKEATGTSAPAASARASATPAEVAAPMSAVSRAATHLTRDGRVKVFVTSAGTADGFTDPNKGNRDTVKDLQDSIKDRRSLALAESRDDAAIVLQVMGRETAQVTAGFFGDPARDRIVRVLFQFGDFQTEMTASAQGGTLASGGAWGKAAGKIAKQVDEWVRANSSKLGVSTR